MSSKLGSHGSRFVIGPKRDRAAQRSAYTSPPRKATVIKDGRDVPTKPEPPRLALTILF